MPAPCDGSVVAVGSPQGQAGTGVGPRVLQPLPKMATQMENESEDGRSTEGLENEKGVRVAKE